MAHLGVIGQDAFCGRSQRTNAVFHVSSANDCRTIISNNLLINQHVYTPKQTPAAANNGLISDTSVLEQYKNITNRLRSFNNNNWPSDCPVSTEELSQAGWFYTGHRDRVQCPWCQGAVLSWVEGDTGFGEHKKHFPSCPFVKSTNLHTPNLQLQIKSSPVPRYKLCWKDSPCVKAVLALGYEESHVKWIIGDLQKRGIKEDRICTDLILDEIFAQDDKHKESVCRRTSHEDDTETDSILYNRVQSSTELSGECNAPPTCTPSSTKEIPSPEMAQENEKLKTTLTCKVCLDARIGDLFLPCRHLVCCVECSSSLDQCPLCRERIAGTIKVFV